MFHGKRCVEVRQERIIYEKRSVMVDTGDKEVTPDELRELITDESFEYNDEDMGEIELFLADSVDPDTVDVTLDEEES